MRDLTFSKRVYLYYEDSLSLQQQAEIERVYQKKGLFVHLRGPDYLTAQWMLKKGSSWACIEIVRVDLLTRNEAIDLDRAIIFDWG
jgi:hypothetical protein